MVGFEATCGTPHPAARHLRSSHKPVSTNHPTGHVNTERRPMSREDNALQIRPIRQRVATRLPYLRIDAGSLPCCAGHVAHSE
jgi:hypothetical protein